MNKRALKKRTLKKRRNPITPALLERLGQGVVGGVEIVSHHDGTGGTDDYVVVVARLERDGITFELALGPIVVVPPTESTEGVAGKCLRKETKS